MWNVFQNFRTKDKVKKVVLKRKCANIGNNDFTVAVDRILGFLKGIQPVSRRYCIIEIDVNADDLCFRKSNSRRHVTSGSAPDIQYPGGREALWIGPAEPVKVDGDQE